MSGSEAGSTDEPGVISYAEFGRRFFEAAVTRERVAGAVTGIAGRPIEFGPMGVGPMRLVKVRASGAVGSPIVETRNGEHVAFDLVIPVDDLQLTIDVGLDTYRFTAAVRVHLALTARAAEPLQIVIDIEPPSSRAVEVELHADGLRASVLQFVAGVEGELTRSVVKYVRREIDKPAVQSARVIDVAQALGSFARPSTLRAPAPAPE